MISRRHFLGGVSAAAVSLAQPKVARASGQLHKALPAAEKPGVSCHVKIKIGTGGHGHTYPGATVPFGMVQLSPDTFNEGWDWCSGYNYADNSIMGFSHTHLSGTGIGDMLDVLVVPATGFLKTVPSSRDTPERGYRSRFAHDSEVAEPGYYSVFLRDSGVKAELSATTRAGIHRYTFPRSNSSHFLVDFHHAYGSADIDSAVLSWSRLWIAGNDTIIGSRCVNRWAKGREIHFAMKFSRPFDAVEILVDDAALPAEIREASGKSIKCVLRYPTQESEIILVKTGISGVSTDAALQNLSSEIPAFDFEAVKQDAAVQWERELSKITVEGGTARQKEIFYTSLYHCMLAPTIFDDAACTYKGMDGAVHTLTPGQHNYSTFSLWDTYRAVHPLFTLIQKERVPDFINCLIRMSHESLEGLPVWPLQGKETGCMTGYHSVVVIAEAIEKGFPGIDVPAAYSAMKKRAMTDNYRGLSLYRSKGFIPCDLESESIGKGMDYAYDDWAVAHVAQAAGETADAAAIRARSGNFRNFFDASTGFIRPKLSSGEWAEPFAPNEIGHSRQWRDYTESNAWQATFAVQHDPAGLADLLGGPERLIAKLDDLFAADPTLPADAPVDIAGLVGQYAHGNEPSHHIPYLYVYAGAPWKTQERVVSLLETMYDNQPDGIAGNEDCGQMSAWYVMSAMGFYSVDPVSATYIVGSPIFDRVTIRSRTGRPIVIEVKRPSYAAIYVRSIILNGMPLSRAWFHHKEIADGGELVLVMSESPNKNFGSEPAQFPPSLSRQNV